MPWITTEEVKAIRNALKAKFPEYKSSVTKHHHSSVHVNLMNGPMNLTREDHTNEFWVKERYKDQPEKRDLFQGIIDTIHGVKERKIVSEDGDYGSIPNFYMSLQVGKWDRPYEQTGVQQEELKQAA